jgi:peptidyl-prolyl cis-trans isomerase D
MLDLVRKHARSWLIKVALFLIVIVFIFWGGYSYKERQQNQMARVGDYYVSNNDYNQYYQQLLEMYRRQLGDSFSEDLLRQMNFKKQALEFLIDRYVIAKAARELGLTATPQEVQRKLIQVAAFQTEGKFDQKRYVFILRQNRMSPEAFEQQLGHDVTLQNVELFVKRRALVTEEEIQADFRFNHTRVQVAYVLFDPKSFEAQVDVTEKALEDYYQQFQDRYRDPEKRQISYVVFSPETYLADVQVTENQIRDYYEDHSTDYNKEKEVRAQHILFRVKEGTSQPEEAKIRAEAEKVLAEAKQGKDFTELAKQYSQDPSASENGGDLGYFARGRMVPEFSEAAFNLKQGEIGGLVRTPYGFHIIRVEDVRPETSISLEEARGEIETKLKGERAKDLAHKKAQDLADMAYAQKDIGKAALASKTPLTAAGSWVSQKELMTEFGTGEGENAVKLFSLPEKGISNVINTSKGFLVAQVEAIQAPQLIPFEKVKDRVEKDYRADQGRNLTLKKSSELLANARNLKSLESVARQAQMEVNKSEWFTRVDPDKGLGSLKGDALNRIFELEAAQPFSETPVMLANNRYAVFQLLGQEVPEETLEQERPAIFKRLQEEKQRVIWQTWLADERSKAHIEVFKEP